MDKGLRGGGVDAAQEVADALECLGGFQFRRAAAPSWEHGPQVAFMLVQRLAFHAQGRDDRDLGIGQLLAPCVLFEDLGPAPAAGAVELGDDPAAVIEPDLEHPVFIRVQLKQAAIAPEPLGLEGVQHDVRRQGVEAKVALAWGSRVWTGISHAGSLTEACRAVSTRPHAKRLLVRAGSAPRDDAPLEAKRGDAPQWSTDA